MKPKAGKVLIQINDYHSKFVDIPPQAEIDIWLGARYEQEAKNRMYQILIMRSQGQTQHEVGLAFDISRERARQLEVAITKAVRKSYFQSKPSSKTEKS